MRSYSTMTDNSQLVHAIALFQKGHFSDAIVVFESMIASDPNNCDALHYYGILKAAMGNSSEAETLLQRSLSAQGTRIPYTENYVQILFQARRFEDAVRICRDTILAHGVTEKLQYALAISLFKNGRLEESLSEFDRLLNEYPNNIAYYNEKGSVLGELGRFDDALIYVERALALNPKHPGALLNKGNVLCRLHKYHQALDVYHRALSVAPPSADLFLGCGNALQGLRRYDEALTAYDSALTGKQDLQNAWLGRGNVFWYLKRYADALAAYDRALAIKPDLAEAWVGRGNVYTDIKRYDEAFAAYDRALTIKPNLEIAWLGRGNALGDLKRYDEAFTAYDKALSINPRFGEAHFSEGLLRLLLGDAERGWNKYEWRWETKERRGSKRDFLQPRWSGCDDINKKTILIHAEQGLGDTIMGCRYIPMVAALGAEVIAEVQPPLKSLLQSLDGVSTLIAKGEPIPQFDVQCPLMSLPLAFRTTLESIPANIPYLSASRSTIEKWRSKIVGTGIKIGIAWAGNPNFQKDHDRSILLQNVLPILKVKDARVFCLQKDLRDGDNIILNDTPEVVRLDGEINDFQDTAAIMTALDLIISSDTSIVNLAGALGIPVWVLLPFNADWRWFLDREDSPWYPTARLFRQKIIGDWTTVVAEVCMELEKLVGRKQ
jgi:tetratricopeptide (TPR) repeat protein